MPSIRLIFEAHFKGLYIMYKKNQARFGREWMDSKRFAAKTALTLNSASVSHQANVEPHEISKASDNQPTKNPKHLRVSGTILTFPSKLLY